MSKFADSKL